MNAIQSIEEQEMRKDLPSFNPGDKIRVYIKVKEGDKERIQPFEGIVIAIKGSRNNATFTMRKISYGVAVERIFPLHSLVIQKIEVLRRGDVARAKLYYLRKYKGKKTRIKEKRDYLQSKSVEEKESSQNEEDKAED
jgi:large subunit ribosomal protein L19